MAGRVKAATTAAHSKNYDKVRRYYVRFLYSSTFTHIIEWSVLLNNQTVSGNVLRI